MKSNFRKSIPVPEGARPPQVAPSGPKIIQMLHNQTKFIEWVSNIQPTIDKPSEEMAAEGEVFVLKVATEHEGKTPLQIRKELFPLEKNLMASLGAVIVGIRFGDIQNLSGLSYSILQTISSMDREGFRILWEAAFKEREARRQMTYNDLLADRVTNGTLRPFVVRRGKNHDEIEMVSVQNDNLLAKAAELSVAAKTASSAPAVAIGNQINFVSKLPDCLTQKTTKTIDIKEE